MNILDFYLSKEEPNKSCLLALRDIILQQDNHITETQKYGMPCFCYKQKMFCYLWTDKKTDEPYILMVEGKHLDHPALETGERARMKILRVNPGRNLPIKTITNILQAALDVYRKGIVKVKEWPTRRYICRSPIEYMRRFSDKPLSGITCLQHLSSWNIVESN